MPRAIGPFLVIKKYGTNAYKVRLLEEYNISPTFNIGDLTFHSEATEMRTILSEEGGVEINGSNSHVTKDGTSYEGTKQQQESEQPSHD